MYRATIKDWDDVCTMPLAWASVGRLPFLDKHRYSGRRHTIFSWGQMPNQPCLWYAGSFSRVLAIHE